jgi:hypothetical protein
MKLTLSERDVAGPIQADFDLALAEAESHIGAWSNEHVKLPRGNGSTPHDDSITPYWREALALVRERILGAGPGAKVERITIVCATQVGKTWGLISPTLAWIAANHPRDIGIVLPTHDTAKSYATTKLVDLFDKSPRLNALLPSGKSARDERLGSKAWRLDRLHLHFLNGSLAQDLRRLDLPVLLPDEFDALPQTVKSPRKNEGEGSPIGLMDDRQKSFDNRLWLGTTTCTTVDSHGWQLLCAGTHERLHIACQVCGAHHYLDHEQLKPVHADLSADQLHVDDAVRWHCPTCQAAHATDDLRHRVAAATAVRGWTSAGGWVPGHWKQTDEGDGVWSPNATRDQAGRLSNVEVPARIHRSFWLNALYSRFITCGQFLARRRRAEAGTADDMQTWANGWAAMPWIPKRVAATRDDLAKCVVTTSDYQFGSSPFPCRRLLLTADQQGHVEEKSWFPWVLRAWDGTRSALVAADKCQGFRDLARLQTRQWIVEGVPRSIDLLAIDSANGPMQPAIRAFCAEDPACRLSILGSGTMGPGNPFRRLRGDTHENRRRLCGLSEAWVWNQPYFADLLYAFMTGMEGAGSWRLPSDAPDWLRSSYASEERVQEIQLVRGRRQRVTRWQPRQIRTLRGTLETATDNHWLDCERMQLACVTFLGWLDEQPEQAPVDIATLYGDDSRRTRRW